MRDMKLSQSRKRFLIPIMKGPCLEKLDIDKKTHTQPSGLAMILNLESRIATMFCQKEYMNKMHKKTTSVGFGKGPMNTKSPRLEFLGSNNDSNGRTMLFDDMNEIKWYKNILIPDEFYDRLMSLLPSKVRSDDVK